MDGTTTNTNTTVTEAANAAVENVSKRDCGGDHASPKGAAKSDASAGTVSTSGSAQTEKNKAEEKPSENTFPSERTFTQKEVNEIVEKRLEREKKSSDSKAEEALKRIEDYERRDMARDKGVSKSCLDDVIALASRRMSDSTDFGAALDKVLEDYPHFIGKDGTPKHVTTGVKTGGSSDAADDSKLRAAFGLAPKK